MAILIQHFDGDPEENPEINVTPFIDVILVLLVIFMIAAPLATVDVPLNLPVSTAQPTPPSSDPIVLSVQSNLKLSLGDKPITESGLARDLDAETHGNKQATIFLRADRRVAYGDLMHLMNTLRTAGYLKVALVGSQENE